MKYYNAALRPEERAVFALRELYRSYGYVHYKVGKFEEYDLYADNRSFLKSENILTFTDTDGRLMALKPDITLSIIKNIGNDDLGTHKLFYNENVYRTSPSSDGFREIMQTGLECIGNIDTYSTCEVLTLAHKSLDAVSGDNVLVISHMGYLGGLFDACGLSDSRRREALGYISGKNTGGIKRLCTELSLSEILCEALTFAAKYYGTARDAMSFIGKYCFNPKMREAYSELSEIIEGMTHSAPDAEIYLDFSIVSDMNYYNGIVFRGYVNGIPDSILSGGRYDSLMRKMGKRAGAIGFAVYLDLLERLGNEGDTYDVDVLLLYSPGDSADRVADAFRALVGEGLSVKAATDDCGELKYRRRMRITGTEVVEVDD
ncbi:MAG: ATP phosphoribosyltransferase regulatory subunit [Eubacteriales bacterium]